MSTEVCLVKAMVFPVVMYECESWTIKKAECWRIAAFELWCWRRLSRVPWTARRSNQSILKEMSPGCSLVGLMLKLKLQSFGHLMRRADSFEKTLMLGKMRAGEEGDDRGWVPGANTRDPTPNKAVREKTWGQGESGFQGFRKGQLTRSHPWQGHEEKAWQARQIRFSGISKSCPGAHLKYDICLSDACLNGLWHRQDRPFPISSQIRINLEL